MNENSYNARICVGFKNTYQNTECPFKLGVRLSICLILASHVVGTWYMLIMRITTLLTLMHLKC